MEAHKALAVQEAEEASAEQLTRRMTDEELMDKLHGKDGKVPFNLFLSVAVDSKPDRSEGYYKDFLRYRIRSRYGEDVDVAKEIVEEEVTKRYKQQHEEGLLPIDAWFLAWEFGAWREGDKARKAHERAKKGAAGRIAKKEAEKERARKEAEVVVSKPTAKKSTTRKATAKKKAPRRK